MVKSKFENRAPSPEEEKAFMEDLQVLTKKHSMYMEAVPQFTRGNEKSADGKPLPFTITSVLFLQKVKEIVEAEKVTEPTPSPYNETDKKAE